MVTVDGHPTAAMGLPTTDSVMLPTSPPATDGTDSDDGDRIILPELGNSFKDPEGRNMIFTAESSNPVVASIVDDDLSGGQAGMGALTINVKIPGTVTLTVTATDTLGQTATHTMTVSVSRP